MNSDTQIGASLDPILQMGLSKANVRQVFESAKGIFKFDSDGIYDFYIEEMMRRKRFIPPMDFVHHCRSQLALGSVSDRQRQEITSWLRHVGQ